ncbi:MAG TPA: 3-isopropylmalate dehydratase small subunit [Polyangia bacterium]|nr:3-isopropylmalate dehydratase small subunit [Polyangia bacterium]
MDDSKRIVIKGQGIVLHGNDIDTDRIIPARYLRTVTFEGLGDHAFEDDRAQLKQQGRVHPFDDAKFRDATVLLVNKNFGCGSSREHAPQAIARWQKGIRVLVGESFAEIFFGNCVSLGLPCVVADAASVEALQQTVAADTSMVVTVDLKDKIVSAGALRVSVRIPEGVRQQFLDGRWDTTGELLANRDAIVALAKKLPYLSGF